MNGPAKAVGLRPTAVAIDEGLKMSAEEEAAACAWESAAGVSEAAAGFPEEVRS